MPTAATKPAATLAEALVALQAELPTVSKSKTATVPTKSGGQYSYSYADLADVTAAAIPLLVKHGLSFTSRSRRCEDGSYELVGVLRHTSGEADEGALPIRGGDMQALGSAITYARRYLLGCMTGIVTDDDDDGAQAAPPASGGTRSRQGGSGRQRGGKAAQEAEPPNELKAAQDLAWAAWGKHGVRRAGPTANESWDAFVTTFAQDHDGLHPNSASAEQLIAWVKAQDEGGEGQ